MDADKNENPGVEEQRQRFAARYEEQRVPWDDPTPPPEIVALAESTPPGRALDVGCGYGRAVIYLAERGWSAVGVDFVPQAIAEARRRATAAGVAGRAVIYLAERGWSAVGVDFVPQAIAEARRRATAAGVAGRAVFHVSSATDLGFLDPPFDLVIDVGCMHSFTEEMLIAYRAELVRLLRPGGQYVLFAHLRDAAEPEREDGPRGIAEEAIHALLRPSFRLERVEHGVTQVDDRPPWRSAWFWFRREG